MTQLQKLSVSRFSHSGARVPLSLFKTSFVLLMVAASSASLATKYRAFNTTFTLFQSTSCSKVHACSASADELKSAWATTLCSSLRPVWPI